VEPLKVTFRFCTPLVQNSEYPIYLDALLAWCLADRQEAAGSANPWLEADDLSTCLERAISPQGEWVWKASALLFTPAGERFMMNMVRRCDPLLYLEGMDGGRIDMKRRRSFIHSGTGQERAYQFLMPYQWMEKGEAWCIGNRMALAALFARLPAIGKMARNGFGLLRDVVITPAAEAQMRWKLRVLPQGMAGADGVTYLPSLQCLRAPYWKKINRIMAQEPLLS